jgi:dihydrofolate synthase/folylpolyglutamate synthase
VSRPTSALDYLLGLELFGMKLGLDNIERLVEALGHPERQYPTLHIAGTNGKGSVTAMVDAALGAAGHRSARYTSPHLIDLTERFVVAGTPVDEALLESVAGHVRDTIAGLLLEPASLRAHPTFFEATTAVAFEIFRRLEVDVAVCEVGLGGRLDATNVLTPVVCAITSIGHDHHEQLGPTLDLVAGEKAGIVKPGVPVVIGRLDRVAADVVTAVARERRAPVVEAQDGVVVRPAGDAEGDRQRLFLRTPLRDYGLVELALAGAHQVDNAVVAVRLLEIVDRMGISVPPEAIRAGLRGVRWPGRLDRRRLPDGREVLFDAAHNPDGARSLAAFLQARPRDARALVFGAMRDKDVEAMIAALLPLFAAAVFTRAPSSRAADPHDLAALARHVSPSTTVHAVESATAALDLAWSITPRVVVAGSIFLVGDLLRGWRGSW